MLFWKAISLIGLFACAGILFGQFAGASGLIDSACPDAKKDGTINVLDLVKMAQAIGTDGTLDITGDNRVDVQDLQELAGKFGLNCFKFVSWSDVFSSHLSPADALQVMADLSSQAKPLNPAFTIFPGDAESTGFSQAEIEAWKSAANGNSNNGLFDITFPVRGNHDFENAAGWQAYFDMSSIALNAGAKNYSAMPGFEDLSYSFDFGNSHFIGLDVPGKVSLLTSAQIAWLDNDLAAAESRGILHAFIYFHGPIYCILSNNYFCSCGQGVKSCSDAPAALISVINKHPIIKATFHGHEHLLLYNSLDSSRIPGLTHSFSQFVNGSSGGNMQYCGSTVRFEYCARNAKSQLSEYGFVLVEVNGSSITAKIFVRGNSLPVKTISISG